MNKTKTLELSEMQYDLLKELFNLGIGNAAASLSQLVNQEVILSVPTLIFETKDELVQRLGVDERVISVSQAMDGPFSMNSMIVFSPEDSFDLVKQLLDQHLSDETLAELQSEALSEIGNIVLNACIGVIADALGESFSIELPVFRDAPAIDMLEDAMDEGTNILLTIIVKMELRQNNVEGHLVFILNTDSMGNLYNTLNFMLESYL